MTQPMSTGTPIAEGSDSMSSMGESDDTLLSFRTIEMPCLSEHLLQVFSMFPSFRDLVDDAIRKAKLDSISAFKFQNQRKRFLFCVLFTQKHRENTPERRELFRLLREAKENQPVQDVIKKWSPTSTQTPTDGGRTLWADFRNWINPSKEPVDLKKNIHGLVDEADDMAARLPDPSFISSINQLAANDEDLTAIADKIRAAASDALESSVTKLVNSLFHRISSLQESKYIQDIESELTTQEVQDLDCARLDMIRGVNAPPQKRSRS